MALPELILYHIQLFTNYKSIMMNTTSHPFRSLHSSFISRFSPFYISEWFLWRKLDSLHKIFPACMFVDYYNFFFVWNPFSSWLTMYSYSNATIEFFHLFLLVGFCFSFSCFFVLYSSFILFLLFLLCCADIPLR